MHFPSINLHHNRERGFTLCYIVYMKLLSVFLLSLTLIISNAFAISLDSPSITINNVKETVESRIETSNTTSDNSWKVATGVLSPILILGGLMALSINALRLSDEDEPESHDKAKEGVIMGSVFLALGTVGLVFTIAF
jgi:Predicted solute binding protein